MQLPQQCQRSPTTTPLPHTRDSISLQEAPVLECEVLEVCSSVTPTTAQLQTTGPAVPRQLVRSAVATGSALPLTCMYWWCSVQSTAGVVVGWTSDCTAHPKQSTEEYKWFDNGKVAIWYLAKSTTHLGSMEGDRVEGCTHARTHTQPTGMQVEWSAILPTVGRSPLPPPPTPTQTLPDQWNMLLSSGC